MSVIVLISELILLFFLRLMGIFSPSDILISLLIFVYSVVFLIGLGQKRISRKYAAALAVGYLFRIALLFFDIYGQDIYILPNSGGDSESFYLYAVNVSNGGYDWGLLTIVMGYFFRYCGVSRLMGQFLLTLCSVISLEYAAKIFEIVEIDDRRARKAMWIVCLLPNFAILSVLFLRESIVTMCISISLYEYLKWFKQKKSLYFFSAIAFSFLGAGFHSGAIAISVGYIFSLLLYDNRSGKLRLSFKGLMFACIMLLAAIFVLNRYSERFLGKFSNVEDISDIAMTSTAGDSSYAKYVGNSSSPLDMIVYTIPRMVFFLYSPMPWLIRGLSDIIAFCFSTCFYLYTTVEALRFLRSKRRDNRELVIVLLIVVLCAAFVFGWGISNSGTACRHRDKMVIVWGVLLGLTMKTPERGSKPGYQL